jgi:glucose-6-phosphate 1-dehydrogenase
MVTLLENPLRIGLQQDRIPEPQILIIFGASGDLTQRKLVPAIYQMKRERRLPPELTIVGVARRDWSHDYFREHLREGVEEFGGGLGSQSIWDDFAKGLFYQPGDIDNQDDYRKLKTFLQNSTNSAAHAATVSFTSPLRPSFLQKPFSSLGQQG